VQVLISTHPGLVPSGVCDLSAGGALPLHLAAAGGWVDVVQALLAAGAPLEAKDGKGLTALQVGEGNGCTGMLAGPADEQAHELQQTSPAAPSALEQPPNPTWSQWID
jgi:ankyrin repeat protein